jgi:hypothetical protein
VAVGVSVLDAVGVAVAVGVGVCVGLAVAVGVGVEVNACDVTTNRLPPYWPASRFA